MNILMFGTGGLAHYLSSLLKKDVNILAYIDSKMVGMVDNIPVISVDKLGDYEYDYVVIAFSKIDYGKKMLVKYGVPEDKIVCYHFNGAYDYYNNPYQIETDNFLRKEWNTNIICNLFNVPEKKYYLCSMNLADDSFDIEHDFVREQTFSLIAREIERKGVKGTCAEVGVFKGEFAKKINRVFSDRKLYLFDTFEGFELKDVKNDKTIGWGERIENFNDTSVEEVLSKMPYRDKCIIKKGYFPQTFDLDEEKFAFVNIDLDLYAPIKSALEIFYPRLSKGGYIMVHDYNNIVYNGTAQAVVEYCDKNGISYVPLADMAGSIVITK